MSEDWNTKYGPRRVRRDPPTLDEAIFAAIGITDDQEAQAEIAASLMGLPIESVTGRSEEGRAHLGAFLDPRDRGRTGRAALGRGRTPGCQEIRQRQAHRDLKPRLRRRRDVSNSRIDRESPFRRAVAQAVRPQPYIRRQQLPVGAVELRPWRAPHRPASRSRALQVRAAVAASDRWCRWIRRGGRSDARRTCWRAPASPGSARRW